jgi:hypothetical protein
MIARKTVLLLAATFVRFAASYEPATAQIRPAPEGCKMLDKQSLARRIEPHAKETADLIWDANTTIEQFSTPFFADGTVYRVINRAPHHPIWFTVGCAGQDYNVMLPMNPNGFMELATKAGLDLRGDGNRLAYLSVFLESTQDVRRRFQILNGVSDIQIISKATDEEKARYQALVDKYRSVIRPPKFADADPSRAVVFALIGQALVEIRLTLSNTGKVDRSDKVLEDTLPINQAK